MVKFIKRLLLLAIILVCLDKLIGLLLYGMVKNAKSGDTARNEYIANKVEAPILVFGSSRAIHHYDPKILSDSLGMDCYNCGQDGMGIVLFYARYKMITQRYLPRVLIYDVLPGFDIEKNDNHTYLTWLRPYYDKNGVDSIFWKIDPNERYKMCSDAYRYNGKIFQILSDNIFSIREENKGYRPAYGVMSYNPEHLKYDPNQPLDSIKLYYMEKLMMDCKSNKTKLFLTMSPFYGGSEYAYKIYAEIYHLAKKYDIPVLCHFNDGDIIYNKGYFQDSYHMNNVGAELYSKKIAHEIKMLSKQELW